ncbi:unnamed protein product [Schistosoma curassoni]|uniref:Uncharacterized protein n=1 Tax=Schistosoma curassoni TaxID=6186 RepID=A0A183KMA1_9TREM|nr:unnamed protein product [Schistosoma curassoni]
MVEPKGTYVPANIARLGHHDRQARPPRRGSSFGRVLFLLSLMFDYLYFWQNMLGNLLLLMS